MLLSFRTLLQLVLELFQTPFQQVKQATAISFSFQNSRPTSTNLFRSPTYNVLEEIPYLFVIAWTDLSLRNCTLRLQKTSLENPCQSFYY